MSGRAKRRERQADEAVAEAASKQARHEQAFRRARSRVLGNDRTLWAVREPVFAFLDGHMRMLEYGIRESLAARGFRPGPRDDVFLIARQLAEGEIIHKATAVGSSRPGLAVPPPS